jgi:hypothetical protein
MPRRPPSIRSLFALACATIASLVFFARDARAGGAGDPGAPWIGQIDLTRATGMAGAMTAFASGNDALTVNPAGLALNHAYHFEIDGMDDVKFPAEGVMISVADSTTAIGVGSGFIFERWGAGQLGGRGEGWLGGISYSYAAGGFLFGGTNHLLHFAGPDNAQIREFTEDLGLMTKAGSFNFGATLQNISLSFDNPPLFPLNLTTGIAYGSDTDWHLAADYKLDLSNSSNLRHTLSFGGEVILDQSLVLRSGYRWAITDQLGWLTFGASVVTEKLSVSVAFRRRVSGNLEQALEAGVTLFLE